VIDPHLLSSRIADSRGTPGLSTGLKGLSLNQSGHFPAKILAGLYGFSVGVPLSAKPVINDLETRLLQSPVQDFYRLSAPAIAAEGRRFFPLEFQAADLLKDSSHSRENSPVDRRGAHKDAL